MKPRCYALDPDGKRCKQKSIENYSYHGDNEIYSWDSVYPQWVLVPLCKNHRPEAAKPHASRRK